MPRGYDRDRYIQPFDHRASLQSDMFAWKGTLTAAQAAEIASARRVIDDGFMAATAGGAPRDKGGILVDEQFGAAVLRDAKGRFLFELPVPAEKAQLDNMQGGKKAYDLQVRPGFMVQAIPELQAAGVGPDIWKVEGLDRRQDCQKPVGAARATVAAIAGRYREYVDVFEKSRSVTVAA